MWASQFQAPLQQAMEPLASLRGVVVRQDTQTVDMVMQALGIPFEKEDRWAGPRPPSGVPFGLPGTLPSQDATPAFVHPACLLCNRKPLNCPCTWIYHP